MRPLIAVLVCVAAVAQPKAGEWQSMFDGKTLQGWRETAFTGRGKVRVENGTIVLGPGAPMTGVTFTGEFPKSNYEVRFEARTNRRQRFLCQPHVSGGRLVLYLGDRRVGRRYRRTFQPGWLGRQRQRDADVLRFREGALVRFPPAGHARTNHGLDRRQADRQRARSPAARLACAPARFKLSAPFGFASYGTTGALRKIDYRPLR